MKSIISKYFVLSISLLLSFSTYAFAETALPKSTQKRDSSDLPKSKQKASAIEEDVEIVPEIKIEAESKSSTKNPKLKQGDACSDENLEEVEGELFTEIPMAETIPCDKVDCKDLKPAKLMDDNYKPLPIAKTISCKK